MILWIGTYAEAMALAKDLGCVCNDPDCICDGHGFRAVGPHFQPLSNGLIAVHSDTMMIASGGEKEISVVEEMTRRGVGKIAIISGDLTILRQCSEVGQS
jgi:hypothetical protein